MEIVQAGGPGFIIAVVLGVLGIGLALGGLVAAFMTKDWIAPLAACVVLTLVSFCAGCTGVFSYGNTMSKVNGALMNVDPSYRRALEAQGRFEATIPLTAGLMAAVLPGMAAVVTGAVAMRRRSQPRPVPD